MPQESSSNFQMWIDAITAVGTVGALFTALWIAQDSRRPKLSVFFRARDEEEYKPLDLTLINIGSLPLTIHSFKWKLFQIEELLHVDVPKNKQEVQFPIESKPGESILLFTSFQQIGLWQKSISRESKIELTPFGLSFARLQVFTIQESLQRDYVN